MKISTPTPDALPPGGRALFYGAFCWLNRHIIVLRWIGGILRYWPSFAGRLGMAASAKSVRGVLTRPKSFSNTTHEPDLVSGDYLIAMDPGPTYDADRALFDQRLAGLTVQVDADETARTLIDELVKRAGAGEVTFDLIDDYLMWVAFHAIQPVFGAVADEVAVGAGRNVKDTGLQRQYLLEIRYVAGQLLAGNSSTLRVQRRAEASAASLQARIADFRGKLQADWRPTDPSGIERNAVGLAWISHPVTVQSGALAVQELFSRGKVYENLRSKAKELGERVWTEKDFRATVYDHVLELMRFRPIFPLMARDVPRDTEFETGGRFNAVCPAGGKVALWPIAAMFDPKAVSDSGRFCPNRRWDDEGLRWLMFGYGTRRCPAREHAVEIITSALIGLLQLPELRLASDKGKAIEYDGPLMSRMRVRFDRPQGK